MDCVVKITSHNTNMIMNVMELAKAILINSKFRRLCSGFIVDREGGANTTSILSGEIQWAVYAT